LAQISAACQGTNDGQVAQHELLGQTSLGYIAKTSRAKAAAEGGLEDVVVGTLSKLPPSLSATAPEMIPVA
jgi:hypothetical protein